MTLSTSRPNPIPLALLISMRTHRLPELILSLALASCICSTASAGQQPPSTKSKPSPSSSKTPHVYPNFGSVERLDPKLDELIPPSAKLEKLAEGFAWSEGPVWVKGGNYLLFSDVPRNVVFRWKEGQGTTEYLFPSGYTGSAQRAGEPGSNGLALDESGHLVLCQHGDRRVAKLDSNRKFKTLVEFHQGRRFNSPNDLVFKANGDIYFTDPPYGLEGNNADPKKELLYNGVYRLAKNGTLTLLTDKLSFPNGIALSHDESILYVAISDAKNPVIMAYDLKPDGSITNGRTFFSVAHLLEGRKGITDGLKVDSKGNLFATGPGGVLVISPEGKHLGTINTGEPTANCAWGDDGSTLYITANKYLCRIKTSTRGKGFAPPVLTGLPNTPAPKKSKKN